MPTACLFISSQERVQAIRHSPATTFRSGSEAARRLPWLPIKPAQSVLNVAGQNADENSTLGFYRTALAWRRQHPCLQTGGINFLATEEPVLAFTRLQGDDGLLCVFNLSGVEQVLHVTGLLDGTALESVSQNAVLDGEALTLGASGYAFVPVSAGQAIALA